MFSLLTREGAPPRPSERVVWVANSSAQDIVYAITCDKQKTAKHFLLPTTIKALTDNTEIMQLVNRLGHGMSYSQVEENERAICLQKLAGHSS